MTPEAKARARRFSGGALSAASVAISRCAMKSFNAPRASCNFFKRAREPRKLLSVGVRIKAFEEPGRVPQFLDLDAQFVCVRERTMFSRWLPFLLRLPQATTEKVADKIRDRYLRFVFPAYSSGLEPLRDIER